MALCYHGEVQLSPIDLCGIIFLEDFHVHVAAVKSMSALSVCGLKTHNNAVIPPYKKHNFHEALSLGVGCNKPN